MADEKKASRCNLGEFGAGPVTQNEGLDIQEIDIISEVKEQVIQPHTFDLPTIEEISNDKQRLVAQQTQTSETNQKHSISKSSSQEKPNVRLLSSSIVEEMLENMNEDNFVVGRSIKTKILQKINHGAYGSIHAGIFLKTNENVAVKLESLNANHPQLLAEGAIMRHLENGPGIPTIKWFGSYEPKFNVMVMDLLGPSIQQLLAGCGHKFSLKTVLLLADQMLETLDFVHSREYVHRDTKPDNFVIGQPGTDKVNRIYLLDFGLAKKFHRQRFSTQMVSTSQMMHSLAGTIRYMGLHAHDGHGDQPRDDLESLCYVLVYLFKGSLPWQGIRGCSSKEEKIAEVRRIKSSLTPGELCSDMPEEFAAFLDKCRRARFYDAESSARHWRSVFQNLAQTLDIVYDYEFDWVVKMRESGCDLFEEAFKSRGHASS